MSAIPNKQKDYEFSADLGYIVSARKLSIVFTIIVL